MGGPLLRRNNGESVCLFGICGQLWVSALTCPHSCKS